MRTDDLFQLRSITDDLVIYQPYQSPVEGSRDTALRFLKISTTHLPPETEVGDGGDRRVYPLRAIHDLRNYSAVFVPGVSPSLILKSASSPPQVIGLKGGPVRSLSGFNSSACEQGFVYIDAQVCHDFDLLQSFFDLTHQFCRVLCLPQIFPPRTRTTRVG